MKNITIVIPVYNEELNIQPLYQAIKNILDSIKHQYTSEILFIDDGSRDKSLHEMELLSTTDGRVQFIALSRNFGKEIAITAGIHHSLGDAVIIMDADMQHPPSLINAFLEKWEDGADIVIGIRNNSASENIIRKLFTLLFYAILNRIAEIKLYRGETDYRLISRAVIDVFNTFTERNRITRGLIDWLGFKTDHIFFSAPQRAGMRPTYNFTKLIHLAISSFIAHSLFPLKFTGYLGFFTISISGFFGIFIIIEKYILHDPWKLNFSGPAMLAIFIIFLIGIVLSCLGLMALYIATIYAEVINRPLYVIRKKTR